MEVDAATGMATLKGFSGQMADVGTAAKSAQRETSAAFEGLSRSIGIAAGVVTAVSAAFALAARAAIGYASSLSDLSSKTGVNVESLQRLGAAGKLVGVSMESIGTAINKMSRTLVDSPAA